MTADMKEKFTTCAGCRYLNKTGYYWSCDYLLANKVSRGCPPGENCTKKEPAEQGGLEDVREEMADVQIMLDQMKIIHGDIREVEEAKLARLEDCLNKKEEPK